MSWVEDTPDGVRLAVRVTPRARKTAITGIHGDRLKIALQAPPVDGKANEALIRHVSCTLGVRAADIRIHSGARGRDKILLISRVSSSAVRESLSCAMRPA